MSERKNLFLIGRAGHRGDENQLTEMLAYLFQEETELAIAWLSGPGLRIEGIAGWVVETQQAVPGGFCDLVLTAPGEAVVIVESKLGSTTSYDQVAKYMRYLNDLPQPGPKALVLMTQHFEPLPTGVEMEAPDVSLVAHRWQEFAGFLRGYESRLAQDFVAMLEREEIVPPEPFTEEDWEAWKRGSAVGRRLRELLNEVPELVQAVDAGYRKAGSTTSLANGMLRRSFEFETFTVWLAFWPSRKPPRPEDHAFINIYVADTTRPREQRRNEAHAAAERAGVNAVEFVSDWDEYALVHITAAHEVLTATDYVGQQVQLANHLAQVLDEFRELGYVVDTAALASPEISEA